jgi:hypothetical protein
MFSKYEKRICILICVAIQAGTMDSNAPLTSLVSQFWPVISKTNSARKRKLPAKQGETILWYYKPSHHTRPHGHTRVLEPLGEQFPTSYM